MRNYLASFSASNHANDSFFNQAMASQLAASSANSGLNLSAANGSGNNQASDLSTNQQLNEMQVAQQRFMMMMFLYNQFLQAQTQST